MAADNTSASIEYTCYDHQQEMMTSFIQMVASQEFSDVVLQVDSKKFSCHKVILAATCPYFRGMFSSPFAENESNEVSIKGIAASIMKHLINYIYTGKIDIDTENAQDLISAADMLQLDSLKNVCSSFLQDQIRTCNCLGIWNLARQLHIIELEKKAWLYATSSFCRVMEGEELLELVVNDLCLLLSEPSLRVSCEEVVCKCALSWLQHKPIERKQHLKTVMANIHLDQLRPAYIKTTLLTHPVFKNVLSFTNVLRGLMDHLTMNMPCPNAVSLLPLRTNTNTTSGILLLGGKVGHPMNRIHTFSLVTVDPPPSEDGGGGGSAGDNVTHIQTMGNLPTVHKYSAACCHGNTVYLAGMGADMQEVWKYDSASTWTRCRSLRYPRTGLTLNSGFTDTLYAVGGAEAYIGSGPCQNVSWIEEYNILENSWTVVGQLQIPVCYHTTAFYMGKMFIMGGFQRDTKACDKIQMFDTQTHATVKLEMRLPKPMAYGKGLVVREHVILVDKEFTLVFSGSDLLKEVNYNYSRSNSGEEERDCRQDSIEEVNESVTQEASESITEEDESTLSSDVEEPPSNHSPGGCCIFKRLSKASMVTHPDGESGGRAASVTTVEDVKPPVSLLQPDVAVEPLDPPDTDLTSPIAHSFYPYCSSYMVKDGCGVELVAAECLGDQLFVFGGRKDERNPAQVRVLSKGIRACSLKDCLSLGNDVRWRLIGRLDQPTVVCMSAKFKVNKKV